MKHHVRDVDLVPTGQWKHHDGRIPLGLLAICAVYPPTRRIHHTKGQ